MIFDLIEFIQKLSFIVILLKFIFLPSSNIIKIQKVQLLAIIFIDVILYHSNKSINICIIFTKILAIIISLLYNNIFKIEYLCKYEELNISLNMKNYYFLMYYPKIKKSPNLNFESITVI